MFDEIPEAEEEKGPPPKKIQLEDEPSTSSDPSEPKLPSTPSSKTEITFPVNEGSLHDSGRNQEYLPIQEQLPHRKSVYLCGFQCRYCAQSRATVCTHPQNEHLNTMLGCPHCDHHVWSTDAWVKHVHTHHPELPMFIEMEVRACNTCRICRSFGGTCNLLSSTRYKLQI